MKNKIVNHFYIKEVRKNGKGEAPIYLRITINGKRAELSTGRRIEPEMWDKSSERVTGRSEKARSINANLNLLLGKVERYFSNLDAKDELISVHQIILELKGKGLTQMTLTKAYEALIKRMNELAGIDYASSTISKYHYSFNNLKRFIRQEYSRTDIKLYDLDYNFIDRYYSFLRTTEKMMHNSAAKNIKNLNKVINFSITNNWISTNPFREFRCNYVNPPRPYLTEEEIDKIYSKELPVKRLARVRDAFIFQIYTGLSYIDMAGLTEENIERGIDGNIWLVIRRKKTGIRSSIPLLLRALEILNKYKNDPQCIFENKIILICTNQRMN